MDEEQTFLRYKDGHTEELSKLLSNERPQLFDYLLRMTGQISRSNDSIDELYQALLEADSTPQESWVEFRADFYKTAKKFNADIWNADTSLLENASIKSLPLNEQPEAEALDKSLKELEGRQREVIALNILAGFDYKWTSNILGGKESETEGLLLKALSRIDADCSGVVEQPESKLSNLVRHGAPAGSIMATIDLGETVGSMRNQSLTSPLRIIIILALAGAAAYAYFFPESIHSLLPGNSSKQEGTP